MTDESDMPSVDSGAGESEVHPMLRRGDTGEWVRRLQALLRAIEIDVRVDGDFGPATEIAVRSFQHLSGLEVNGVVDKLVWVALEKACSPSE